MTRISKKSRVIAAFLVAATAIVWLASRPTAWVPQVASNTWAPIVPDANQPPSSMTTPRTDTAATLIMDGRVLISGGSNPDGLLASAEVLDWYGSFLPVAPMSVARSHHASISLLDGRILVSGGTTPSGPSNTAEIYDPSTDSWTPAGSMLEPRSGHTMSMISNGRVLVAGGDTGNGASVTMEIFDPVTGTFTPAGTMAAPRMNHAATTMNDGRVLIAGGNDGASALSSVDIFDPKTGVTIAASQMSVARAGLSATTLIDGKVLLAGGSNGSTDLTSADIYDPEAGSMSGIASTLTAPRRDHLGLLLPNNGSVLFVGGTSNGSASPTAEVYEPWTDAFRQTAAPSAARLGAAGTAMGFDGRIFLAGGSGLASAELYGFASVKTDKPDYQPGETVTITGTGWQPGEAVNLVIHEVQQVHDDRVLTAVADAAGNISNTEFSPEEQHLGVRFLLTASGAGSIAQNVFKDARTINSATLSFGSTVNGTVVTVAPSSSITASVTVTTNGTGGGGNDWQSTGWRISTTAPGSITCANTANHTSSDGTFTESFSITAPSAAGTYNAYFIAYSDDGAGSGCDSDPSNTFTLPGGVVVDGTAPTVTNVTSTAADGTYGVGAVIPVTITFSEPVAVTGTPRITLETGGTDAVVNYSSGTGTNTLTFNYTVASPHTSSDLNYQATNSLALNGGTIRDIPGNNATLTLPATGGAGSLATNKNLIIDTTAPTVPTSPGVTSTTANGTYGVGTVIPITVAFNEPVDVTGTPQLVLVTTSPATTAINYTSGSGTNTLTFNYTVAAGNSSGDLAYQGTGSLSLNGGTIKDDAGNNATLTLPSPGAAGSLNANKAIVIETIAPTIPASPGVNSTTPNGTYGVGANIAIQVNFNEAVTVNTAGGTPTLALNAGVGASATYSSGSGGTALTFTYTVGAGQANADLDYASTTALALNGGTIKDAAGNNATLTLPTPGAAGSLGANKAIVIETTAPTVTNVTASTANGTFTTGGAISIQIVFSENVLVAGGAPALALNSGGAASYSTGSGGSTLNFSYTVGAGQNSADLDYNSTGALTLPGGVTIKDAAGNNATLTLAAPGTAGSLGDNKNLVIDTTAPTVTNVTSSTPDGLYGLGQNVSIQVTFTENVTVTGTPTLTLNSGGTASYSGGSTTSTLTFSYAIGAGQSSGDLDYSSTSALALSGGTVKDAGGNNATLTLPTVGGASSLGGQKAIVIETTAPTVSSVSSSTPNGTYSVGASIALQVTFSETVNVVGTPQLTLATGGAGAPVNYSAGSGSDTLTFSYTVASGHTSADLDYTSTGALALNGGSIKDAAGNNATLTLPTPGASGSLGANKNIVVDTATSTSIVSSENPTTYGQSTTLTATVTTAGGSIVVTEGNAQIIDGGTCAAPGTVLLASTALNGSGQVSVATSALSAGSHTIIACYLATANYPASNGSIVQTVNPASTSASISAPAVTYSADGAVTVTVSSDAGTPSGDVSLTVDGGAPLTQALSGGSTTFALTSPSAGDHSLSATYAAQGNFDASSATGSLHVNPAATTASISAPAVTYNANGQVTVTVTSGAGTPGNNVSLTVDGGAPLTQALSAGSTTFTLTSPNAGDHSLNAAYAAQGNFDASVASGTLHVDPASTTTALSSDQNPADPGALVTFTAIVTVVSPGAGVPNGIVEFFDGGDSLGTQALVGGSASISTSTLALGAHSITVVYGGTPNFIGSTSPSLDQIIDAVPVGSNDVFTILQNGVLTVGAPGVLGNDNDADAGQTITASLVAEPANAEPGSFALHADGSFDYTPALDFAGIDTFTYKVNDGFVDSATTTVSINVVAPTATPVAAADSFRTTTDAPLAIAAPGVLGNDNNLFNATLTAIVVSGPTHAESFALNSDGSFDYTPATGFTGTDSFTYRADNGANESNVAMVTIAVSAPAATPVAVNDSYGADQNAVLSVPAASGLLANDIGLPLTAELTVAPLYGSLTLNVDGSFDYEPGAGFNGFDGFLYRLTDGIGSSNVAMVTIHVRQESVMTVDADNEPSVYGDAVTFTASFIPSELTGTVQFKIDGSDFGSPVTISGGTAVSDSIATLNAGTHTIDAIYSGDSTHTAGNGVLPHEVTARPASVTPDAATKEYGAADPVLTGALDGFLAGDNVTAVYSRTSGETVAGGPYVISAELNPAEVLANYAITYNTAGFTITARAASVTPNAATKEYGSADPVLSGTLDGFLATDNVVATYSRTSGESVAGSPYEISAVLSPAEVLGNYNITYNTAAFTIAARNVTVAVDAQSKTYGDADPALTYQISNGSLVNGDGFTGDLTREAGENVGTYAIAQGTLALSGDYALTFVGADLTIASRAVTVTADAQSKTYGEADPALTYQVSSGSLVNGDSFTGALTRAVGETVGSYAITQGTLALSSDYELTFVGADLTITSRAVTVTADPQTKTYGEADPAFTYQITSGSLVNGDSFTGALTRAVGETVGSYAITQGTLALSSDYELTFVGADLTITSRAVTVTADPQTKTYGEADPAFTYQITSGSLVNGDSFTGALTRAVGESVGTYAMTQGTLALSSDYSLTFVGADLTITSRAVTVTADPQTKIYGEADPALTYQVTSGSLVNGDSFTGALVRAPGENVGSYAITQSTLALSSDYTLTFLGADLTITSRAVTVTADPQTKIYGEADPALTYQVTSGSLVNGDSFTGALTRAPGENVGSYAITQGALALSGDYTLTFLGADLTITSRAVTVTADAQTKTYGEADPAFTYQITSGSLVNGDSFTGALTRAPGENVGSYAITQGTLALSSDYTLTFLDADLTITSRAVTVTADPQTKTYGEADPALTYQITSGALVNGDGFTGGLVRAAGENVGAYAITQGTLALPSDYTLTFIGADLTITSRAVTVTADAQTKIYGDADPALTYQITSGALVNGDGFTGSLVRAAGENVGTYAITQGTLALSSDYTLTFLGADLTITARAVTVTADAQTKTYGEADPALTYQITSGALVNGDGFTGGLVRAPGENVGSYAISQGTLALSGDYSLTFVGADFTITSRAVTVTADPQTKTYGEADPALTYQITSGALVNGDSFSGGLVRAPGENVGSYAITQGTLALSSDYTLTFIGADLTITSRAVTVTADPQTKIYGDADPALTYQISSGSLVNGDGFTGGLVRAPGENVGSYAISQGTLALSGDYSLTFVGADFTITSRAVTVTADPQTKIYGDADPALTYQITSGALVNGDSFTGALVRAPGENVGPYAVTQGTLALSGDYTLTFLGADLTITSRAVTVTADAQTKTYGNTDPALTYQITSGALVNGDGFTGALVRAPGETVGSYAISQGTLALSGDYTLTFVGADLTITSRAVTVTADPQTKTYGEADPALTYQITAGTLASGDSFTGGLTRNAGENVGSYAISQGTLALSGDYALTFLGADLTITSRAVTVTADAQTKIYGDADPALTYQITTGSLVNGDAFSGALVRAPGENVGSYAISQGTLALSGDYALTFIGADLTITSRAVTVTADAQTKTYGEADPALTYQITSGSLVNGDSFTGALTRAVGESVGTYAISQGTLALSSDYTLTFLGADLTITSRAVTVTADAQTKIYGDADPALTYQITAGTLASGDGFTGGLVRAPGENVGSYAISQGMLALSGDYTLTFVGADLTIMFRAVTVTADAQTKTYGNTDPALTYQITSGALVNGDSFTGGLVRAPGDNVGSYAISQGTLALSGDYTLTFLGADLTITSRAVTVTADPQTKTYGEADPALTYQITSGALVNGDSFTGALVRAPGENVGPYAITQGTLALSGDYTLTFLGADLTITSRAVTVTADAQTKTYGDADPALTYQITAGTLASGDSFTGGLTRNTGENVGSYAISQGTLALSGDYTLTFIGADLTITSRAVTVTADAQTKIYGEADPALTYQITAGTLVNGDSFTGGLVRAPGDNVGSYAISQGTLALSGDYTLTFLGADLTITARAVTVTADPQTKTYGEADPALTYQITSGALVNGDGFTGGLVRAPGENVGSYAITQGTLALSGDYTLTFVGADLTITSRAVTVTADAQTKTYGDADPALTYQITSGALVNGDSFTGALTRAVGENVGTYAITQGTLALSGDYTLTFLGADLTITSRAVTVTADTQSKGYGTADPALTYQVSSGSLASGDAFTGELTREAGENVGSYAVTQGTLALSGNYSLTFVGANLTITLRTITVTADAKTKIYGDADPALTYQVTSGSLVNGDSFTGALDRDAGEAVGTYAITQGTLALSSDYTLTFLGADLTITSRAVTVTADAQTKTYGEADPALTYQITSGALVNGDSFTGALVRAPGDNVGSYAISQGTLALSSDYTLTFNGADLTVNSRTVTVTAEAKNKVYSDADPALTYQITSGSLADGDSFAGALERDAGENVGSYPITQGTLALSTDYTLTFVGADLTITSRAVTVTADPQTKIYGDADPALTYQVTEGSLANGDGFTGALTRVGGDTVGAHAITQGTLALNSNYTLTYQGANLAIGPRPVTVTADTQAKGYGTPDPALTYQITSGSLVSGDNFTGALSRDPGENVGAYAITQGTLALSSNYALSYQGANLTIGLRLVTVTADAQSKIYGEADPALTYQITSGSLADGDAFSGAIARAAGENAGSYAITQGTLALPSDYTLVFVPANLTIGTRAVTITADAKTKMYGEADPEFTYQITSGALANGDSFSGALTRDAGENVGSYAIRQGTLALSSDYTLSFVSADLAVTSRPVTVTVDAKSKTYGDDDPSLTYQITSGSLAGGDAFTGGLSRDAGENVGNYAINQGTLALPTDYTLTFISADLTIGSRAVTVTAEAKSKTYGNTDPALTYQVSAGSLASGDSFVGSLTRDAGENVGSYAITQGTLALNGNYALSYQSALLTIGTRPVTVTADAQAKGYGTPDPVFSYQITGGSLANGDVFSGALSRDPGENVGTYAITQGTLALSSNYALSYQGANLTIGLRLVTVTADAQSKTYGDADPALTYQITAGELVNGDSFSGNLSRNPGESVGSYQITQGTLALPSDYTLVFVPANLTIGTRAVTATADAKTKTYGEADPAFTYQITSGSLANGDVFAGGLTRDAGENVGSYAINQGTLALSTNYALTYQPANLTIGSRAVTVTADAKSKTYGDADPSLTYQITSGSLANGDAFSGGLTRDAGENVGSYAINQGTLALPGDYALSFISANLSIGSRAVTVTADAKSKTYGDADPALTYQVTSGTLASGDGFSGGLTRAVGENVGSYPINQGTLALTSNYALTYVPANLTIGVRAVTVTADAQAKGYGTPDPALTYHVSNGSLVNGDGFNGGLVRDAGENVGAYAINQGTLSLSGNYSLSYVGANLTIGLRLVTVTADAKSKTYGEADPLFTYQITAGELVNGDGFTGALSRDTGESVGGYGITQGTLALPSDYTLVFVPANLTIGTRAVTATADAKTKTYGEVDPAFTYQITSGSLANGDSFAGDLTRDAGENVGSYAITQGTLALSGNYALTYQPANLTIGSRAVTVTADAKSKTYGNADPALTYQVTSGSLASGDSFSGGLVRDAGESVGSYAINQGTLALSANYTLTFVSADLTIGSRAVTVTADAKNKIYGDDDPSLTYQITSGSLASGDGFSGGLSRDAGENVGSYAINQGSLALNGNYTLTYQSADLTIAMRAVTATADAKSKVFGENDPTLTYQVTNGSLVNGDDFTGALTRDAGESVGTYAITQGTLTLSGNYALTYQGANLIISNTATSTSITLHAPDPSVVNESVNVQWQVTSSTSGTPTGTVTVSDGLGTECSAPAGDGACSVAFASAGPRNLVATYSGDSNFAGSASSAASHTVNVRATSTAVVLTPANVMTGQPATLDVTVTDIDAAGTKLFPAGSVSLSSSVGSDTFSGACTLTPAITLGVSTCSVGVTPHGASMHSLSAMFPASSTHATSNGSGTLMVQPAATTTTVSNVSPAATVVGQSYTVSWTVDVNAPGAGTPAGMVTVDDGTGGTCQAAAAAGSCSLTSTSAGTKTITAAFTDDSNFSPSNGTTSHVVNPANTTVSITGDSPDPSTAGQAYQVSWSVSVAAPGAGTPTGNVTVTDGLDTCQAAVSAGSCQLTSTTTGAKTLIATYSGDDDFNGNASAGVGHQVNANVQDTTTTISSHNPDPSVVGQSITVAYHVASSGSGTPIGSVVVSSGALTCTGALDASGDGSCTLTFTTPGAKSITAAYGGASGFNGSTSAAASHTVNKADTTTSISSDTPDPSAINQAVVVTVQVNAVAPGAGTRTGTVTIASAGIPSCNATINAGGSGSCSLTFTTSGTKSITATYNGDTNFNISTSAAAPHVVNAVLQNTTTSITSRTPTSSVVGQSVTVNYHVTPSGSGTPTGTVVVSAGVNSCSGSLNAAGNGNCAVAFTSPGTKSITAAYSGNATFNGSTSAPVSHSVSKANTTTTISSDTPDPSSVNQAVVVTVQVNAVAPGAGTRTGTVTVSSAGIPSCNATISASGAGSCSLTFTSSGTKTITAVYGGDANFNTSSAPTASHVVSVALQNTTTTITSRTPTASVVGQSVTVNYNVAPATSGTPTGTVVVSAGSNSCSGTVNGLGNGSCALVLTSPGTKSITAAYGGSATFNGSTSAAVSHVVSKANTTTSITADTPDPSALSQAVLVTVQVSAVAPGAGTRTGTVTVSSAGIPSCNATINASGVGSCSLTFTSIGTKTITASYAGDVNFNGSASAGASHEVTNKLNTAVQAVSFNPVQSRVGEAVAIAFKVTPQGTGTPTGTVQIQATASELCSGSINATGNGSCSIVFTSAGNRTITLTYGGDANFNGSTASDYQPVNTALTTTTITSDTPDPSVVNQAVTVAFKVTVNAPGAGTPTGTVNVSSGTAGCSATISAAGTGSCSMTFGSTGSKTITATYNGNSNFHSSSGTATHQVNP